MNVLYAGTLPPHQGGSAIACAQLLRGLAARGHRIRSIAPITDEELARGDRFAESAPELGVVRYPVPHFETSPDRPQPPEFCVAEQERVVSLARAAVAEERPNVIVLGRETFAWAAPELADAGVPIVLIVHGSLLNGIELGTFPS